MGRIQTSIGLITGTDIVGTVDKLIAISGRPRDRLLARTKDLQSQQTAIAELTALVIGVQFAGKRLDVSSQYQARSANSSNADAISATVSANAPLGTIKAKTIQAAATHGVQSKSLATDTSKALGLTGEIQVRAGGFINSSVSLNDLNQGRGVAKGAIRITDRSGASQDIDLSKASNIDDVLEAINSASGVRVKATTVGDTIRLTDASGATTSNLRVDEVGGGETAADLGLRAINVAANSATGTDIYGAITDTQATGLQGVSLSKLRGGAGISNLTTLTVRTTNGNTANVNLSSATTTQDVIRLLNESGLNIEAKINDSGTGFRIRDLSGGSSNGFTISSTDDTATKLGISVNSTSRIIEGQDLGQQFVSRSTKLSELRQGRGVSNGTFIITNSRNVSAAIELDNADEATVGNIVDSINAARLSVTAAINATGDGIQLTDTSGGNARLRVRDSAGQTTASDLGFNTDAVDVPVNNTTAQRINARQADTIQVKASDSLQDIVERINKDARFATASVATGADGGKSIAFRSARGGEVGRISVSSSGIDLGLLTTSRGQDAILDVQMADGSSRQLRTVDGVFDNVAEGVTLTAKTVTESYVDVTVERNTETAVTNVKAFVNQYNKLVEKLDELTFFSQDSSTVGLLFGSNEALRIESGFTRILSGRITGAGSIRGIGELGITFSDNGKLDLNETKLTDKLTSDPDAVDQFLTKDSTGLVARLDVIAERIAGVSNSLLISRTEALGVRIQRNTEQADAMQVRLDKERERLLTQFYSVEEAISKIQSNQNAISQIRFFGSNRDQ